MGRLIDADKLLEETRRDRDYARKNGFLDMYYERQTLIDRIESQPTAFDVDKVVAQLQKYRLNFENRGILPLVNMDYAVEVVRNGGKE